MKKLFLIAIGVLLVGSLFAQTERTTVHTKQLVASDVITGRLKQLKNTSATVALTVDSCLNIVHVNADADAIEYDLPAAEEGLLTAFRDGAGGAITVDPNGTEYIEVDGVSAGAGTAVVSDGTKGRYMVLVGENGYWVMLPTTGWE